MSKYNINKIMKIIDNYNYVSFDIFDTLIKRNLNSPNDIFNIVKSEYELKFKKSIPSYINDRINAENIARIKFSQQDPTFDNIYNCLGKYTVDETNILKELEINTEFKYCQCNFHFKQIYDYCVQKGKNIIFTSDMYLSRNIIETILKKCNYHKYKQLYISCELQKSKRNGNIYKYIINDLKISGKQIIHIGDSIKNDYIMAKKNGINAILIPKYVRYTEFKDNDSSVLYNYINNNIEGSETTYYKLGYELLGPILYGFSKWLLGKLKEKNIQSVYFLAREGKMLKRAFEIVNNESKIKTNYLYCSRRSTRVPLLKNIDNIDDVFEIVKMRRIIDIESFMLNIGLNCEDYADKLQALNIKPSDNIKHISNFDEFFNAIKNDIIANANVEEKALLAYLKQEKFNDKIAICDVGWVGTMQNSLCEILSTNAIDIDMYGFYLGLNPEYKKTKQSKKMDDYMFSNTKYSYIDVASFLNLFESFFLAQHGSTIKYITNNGQTQPKLAEYEYKDDDMTVFTEIQTGALDFVRNFDYDIDFESSISGMFRLGKSPTLREIKLFKNLKYTETKSNYFVNKYNLVYYIIHPKKIYEDFCNCSWKIGFLKNVFKIKMDYFKLYTLLKKRVK